MDNAKTLPYPSHNENNLPYPSHDENNLPYPSHNEKNPTYPSHNAKTRLILPTQQIVSSCAHDKQIQGN